MVKELDNKSAEPKAERTAPRHCESLARTVAPLEKAIRLLAADGTQESILALFDNRTTWNTIRDWRRGKRKVAPWAIELIERKGQAVIQASKEIERGPGQSAGWRNVAGYVANR